MKITVSALTEKDGVRFLANRVDPDKAIEAIRRAVGDVEQAKRQAAIEELREAVAARRAAIVRANAARAALYRFGLTVAEVDALVAGR